MGKYKYDYNWNFFEEDSEELYYFLGFVAADGYISYIFRKEICQISWTSKSLT